MTMKNLCGNYFRGYWKINILNNNNKKRPSGQKNCILFLIDAVRFLWIVLIKDKTVDTQGSIYGKYTMTTIRKTCGISHK